MSLNRNLLIVMLVVLAVTAAAGYYFFAAGRAPATAYREVAVARGGIEVAVLATGVVQPRNRLEIKPPIAGRVEEVLAEEGQDVSKGQMLGWMSSTERAALLDAARARGPEEAKRWEELYRPTPIFAPIRGMIIARNVEPGQTFTGQDAVFVMSDRLIVKAQVDETDIARIKLKQKARIVLDAYPERTFAAYVEHISYEAKTVNNVTTYTIDVLPQGTPAFMRAGMTANVSFVVAAKDAVLWLPAEAVKRRDGRAFVLAAAETKGNPREKEIQTGLSDGKRVEVVAGLSEGEVVLAAQLKPKSGGDGRSSPLSPVRQKK